MGDILLQTFLYLCAAVVAVPIANRLGLGSVLGYLIAGIVIGPVFGLVGSETQEIQHFAEFGVVMMLFLVGLELEPQMLWRMRHRLLGLGGLQVLATAALVAGVGMLLGQDFKASLAIGLIFSLSSTAIVLQTLNEKGLSKTDGGQSAFSVLLFQDIAVIPMLALLPLLAMHDAAPAGDGAGGHGHEADAHHSWSLVADLPGWAHALVVLGTVAAVIVGGYWLSRPLFRFIAASRLREIFTASALLLVIGIALLMQLVELSPALGTFLAGVVLANSEFRHELESDIEPFKGLLLGLFFITVGAGIDFALLLDGFGTIIGLTIGVIAAKGLVLYGLSRLFRLQRGDGWLFTLSLAQAGEFGFVLLGFSLQQHILPEATVKTLLLVVALSMLLTPALFLVYENVIRPRMAAKGGGEADEIDETGTVIVAGIGRFGQIVNRLLAGSGVKTVVLDHEAAILETVRRFGRKVYYGDASRPDLLHAAGIESASLLIVAIDDRERAITMTEHVKRHHPHVKVLARAFDRGHLYRLKKAGADLAVRELFDSSLTMGKEALKLLGQHPFKVERMARSFRDHDEEGLMALYDLWDEESGLAQSRAYMARAKEHSETLAGLMETDRMQAHDRSERGWTPPPKGYASKIGDDADEQADG